MATKLSKAVAALVVAGASATAILNQFLDEKEGTALGAYLDGSRVWTICKGHTAGVKPGDRATREQCDRFFETDVGVAFAAIDRLVKVPMSEPQRAAVTSFCAFNIGPTKCSTSTFLRKLNAGDRVGACREIPRWIFDGGRDCRIRANNCFGQVERRAQEEELCLTGEPA